MAASLFGVWLFTWSFVAFGIASLVAAGMAYDDATTLLYLVAFVVFLVLFLWSFAAASVKRVWLWLAGGSGVMAAAAAVITRGLS